MPFHPPGGPQPPEPLLLNARDAAKTLAISERTLHTLSKAGDIPVIRFGRTVRFSLADLRQWIASKRATAGTSEPVQAVAAVPEPTPVSVPESEPATLPGGKKWEW